MSDDSTHLQLITSLITAIQSKRYPGGRRLPPERQLAEELGVSRASLREALKALEIMGFVETVQGGGTLVRKDLDLTLFFSLVSPALFTWDGYEVELAELRIFLEEAAVKEAARRITWETARYLKEPMRIMRIAVEHNDPELGAQADMDFHQRIFRIAEKPILRKAAEIITALLEVSSTGTRKKVMAGAENPKDLYEQHKRILDAIIAQDVRKASRAMKEHLEAVLKIYRQVSPGGKYLP